MRYVALLLAVLALAGCSKTGADAGNPQLSLVGEGLSTPRAQLPVSYAEPPKQRTANSLWVPGDRGLFYDRRANRVGDIVTVNIQIDDKAKLDNTSGRSHQGGLSGTLAGVFGFSGFGVEAQEGETAGNVDVSGSANSKASGSIDRSEKLSLAIAAVVTEVLPDGNLFITGTQEVQVNHEVRVLTIAGIVRPLDIAAGNWISYEKIAEARISYGGRRAR